jgi:hypothetical protein
MILLHLCYPMDSDDNVLTTQPKVLNVRLKQYCVTVPDFMDGIIALVLPPPAANFRACRNHDHLVCDGR